MTWARLGTLLLRLELESRLEPLADNLMIFMKKYHLERASCMHDIFKSRQFELACGTFRSCSKINGNSGITPNGVFAHEIVIEFSVHGILNLL